MKNSLTFSKDVAPIVFRKCATCHHVGEIGPFPLVSYDDVRKRVKQVVEVVRSRSMPPWPAAPGYCRFEGDRSLSVTEIGLIGQWAGEGCHEGIASDLPPLPKFPGGWKLGKPDLILTLPEPYVLSAAGKDIYRKFVLRVPLHERRYVRAYDFDPGNRKVVHHAMIRVDSTGWSRYLDRQDPLPGFEGTLMGGDEAPDGFLMGWSPGYTPDKNREGFAWRLDPGTDIVLELHLLPTGKAESIQPSLALYFTPRPPERNPCLVQLQNGTIDIPPGQKDYVVEDEYVLPVGAKAIDCWPHAHFLCRDMQFYAILPDGGKTWLLRIKDWDFNWQYAYKYVKPILLPAGTRLRLRLQYDNSADNLRNPHNPPRRVHYGRTSEDEMGQVTLRLLPQSDRDADVLREDFAPKEFRTNISTNEARLSWKPDDWEAHYNLGLLYRAVGDPTRTVSHYQEAVRLNPSNNWAHNNLGTAYLGLGKVDEAIVEYTRALEIDPKDSKAHNNLGLALLRQGKLDPAAAEFERALRENPHFPEAETNLGRVFAGRGDAPQATAHFERALKIDPENNEARTSLAALRHRQIKPARRKGARE
jgi:tetratricopeptide (TPR) repeat protein